MHQVYSENELYVLKHKNALFAVKNMAHPKLVGMISWAIHILMNMEYFQAFFKLELI